MILNEMFLKVNIIPVLKRISINHLNMYQSVYCRAFSHITSVLFKLSKIVLMNLQDISMIIRRYLYTLFLAAINKVNTVTLTLLHGSSGTVLMLTFGFTCAGSAMAGQVVVFGVVITMVLTLLLSSNGTDVIILILTFGLHSPFTCADSAMTGQVVVIGVVNTMVLTL